MLLEEICNASQTSVEMADTRHKAAAAIHQQPSTLAADATAAALGAVPAEECATAKRTKEQPPQLAADSFPAALGSPAPELWHQLWEIFLMSSTWAADRTIMLRMTSKKVREAVDKIRPPAVVCLSKSFWNGTAAVKLQFVVRKLILRKGTAAEKLKFVVRKLALMTVWCRITTLDLRSCEMKGHGSARLAGVLPQCPALAHLDLSGNQIGQDGAESLAGVLGQCTALAHLDLCANDIGTVGRGRLRASWLGQASGLLL
jgi:hypothetical protein